MAVRVRDWKDVRYLFRCTFVCLTALLQHYTVLYHSLPGEVFLRAFPTVRDG